MERYKQGRRRLGRAVFLTVLLSSTSITTPVEASPQAAIVIAGAALAASPFATGLAAFSWSLFAVNAGFGLALQALSLAQTPSGPTSGRVRPSNINVRESVGTRTIVYGRRKVAGKLIYIESVKGKDVNILGARKKDRFLHLVFVLAGHEIDGIDEIYIADDKVTLDEDHFVKEEPYGHNCRILFKMGTDDQTAFDELIAESDGKWTEAHRARGCALMYVRLRRSVNSWPNGVPNFSVVLRGAKVRNHTTGIYQYSTNAVDCLRDYMFARRLGLREDQSRLDAATFTEAAQVCDEDARTNTEGVQVRYSCNGMIDTGDAPVDILNDLQSAFAGNIVFTGGKWLVKVGAWVSPEYTFDENDIVSEINISTRHPVVDNFNGVRGTFIGPKTNWVPDSYPAIQVDEFVAIDNGIEQWGKLDLPFTGSPAMAQRIAQSLLYRQREQMTVNVSLSMKALRTAVGDTIRLNIPRMGWNGKLFEIMRWKFIHAGTGRMYVDVVLCETSPDVWANRSNDLPFERNNSNMPSTYDPEAPSMSLAPSIEEINEIVMGVISVELDEDDQLSEDYSGGLYELQYRRQPNTKFIGLGRQASNRFEITTVKDGVYDIRGRSINLFGVESNWNTHFNYEFNAFSEPPEDVRNFEVSVRRDVGHFSWKAVRDLDLSHYVMRWSPRIGDTNWSKASIVAEKISRPATSISLPIRRGTYFIRAVDKTGNLSVNPTILVTSFTDEQNDNIVVEYDEGPAFGGTHISTAVVTTGGVPGIVISDLTTPDVDATYRLTDTLDLGSVYTARIVGSFDFERYETLGARFDDASGLFDARPGLFETQDYSDLDVKIQVRTKDANADEYGGWHTVNVGDYTGRFFQFRVRLFSDTLGVSPKVTSLNVLVDMPDRVDSGRNVQSVAGSTLQVSFNPKFKETPAIAITGEDMNTGDYFRVTNKSRTGFEIRFFNAAGAGIVRQFDWQARGFGKERA